LSAPSLSNIPFPGLLLVPVMQHNILAAPLEKKLMILYQKDPGKGLFL
jgi:hypothetical protein